MNIKIKSNIIELLNRPNELRIIRSLLTNGDSSRPELSHLLSLSLSSVTNVVDGLIKKGYVLETGYKKLEKGRSSAVLGAVRSRFVSIGVGISKYKVSVEAIDLEGTSRYCAISNLDPNSWENNFSTISALISKFIDQSLNYDSHVLGIGIARPGFVEFMKKTLPFSDELFAWDDAIVQSYFEKEFSLGVEMASLSSAALSGEVYFGCCKEFDSSLLVNISSTDISIAMIRKKIIDKNIDAHSHVFGKRAISVDANQLNKIHETSLNQYACKKAIEENYCNLDAQKVELDYTSIINQAKMGNIVAVQAVSKAATYIGIAIADLIALLVPQNCVITGEIVDDSNIYYKIATAIARERVKRLLHSDVVFSQPELKGIEPDTDTLTNYSLGKGAASVVFENLYTE